MGFHTSPPEWLRVGKRLLELGTLNTLAVAVMVVLLMAVAVPHTPLPEVLVAQQVQTALVETAF
jgi:hypothetical protein